MKQTENSKVEPEWKSAERIAAILEKALSPEAHVEHNVHLPVIGSDSRRTRQCDVVITFGQAPRQTVAIVEVQKRNKKPDINTFHGWHRKMQEVGAQQLICVSALGYPKSIIEEVSTRIGPTVRLLTLEDIKGKEHLGGFFLLPILVNIHPKYKICDVGIMKFVGEGTNYQEVELKINADAKCFSLSSDSELYSLNQIISNILTNSEQIEIPIIHELSTSLRLVEIIINDSHEVWFHHLETKSKIKNWSIKLNISYEPQEISIPVHQLAYRQVFIDEVLAWISSTQFIYEGKEYELNIVVKPDANGFLSVHTFSGVG